MTRSEKNGESKNRIAKQNLYVRLQIADHEQHGRKSK